jgi:hypothetical protein
MNRKCLNCGKNIKENWFHDSLGYLSEELESTLTANKYCSENCQKEKMNKALQYNIEHWDELPKTFYIRLKQEKNIFTKISNWLFK